MAGSIAMAAARKGVRITDMPLFKLLGFVIAALYCPKERGVALLESVAIFVDVQNILRAIGFEVRLKPYIQRVDGSAKGDWDVGITLAVLEYAPDADVVVLVS